MPGSEDFSADCVQVEEALSNRAAEGVGRSFTGRPKDFWQNGGVMAGAGAPDEAATDDLGCPQTAPLFRPGFWRSGSALGSGDQPLAQALGAGAGKKQAKAGASGFASGLAPGPAQPRGMDGGFQGLLSAGNGIRVEPLTVRDLHSRYGLVVGLQHSVGWQETRRSFRKIFNKYGLPERIRCDHGTPFGGVGPTGLTRLSAWWVKLGIQAEFIAPGRPDQNGAHEQFHRVYKKEVAKNPAQTLAGQQRRSNRWLKIDNQQRPHEALGMKVPARCYRKNRRRAPKRVLPWMYDRGWERRWVKGNGEISRRGKRRFIGEAFVGDYVGLKPQRANVGKVYFGPILIGELHEEETGNIRTARYRRAE